MAQRETEITVREQAPINRPGIPGNTFGRWNKGESGNPGGRPKRDLAAEMALKVFEDDPDGLKEDFRKAMKKASPQLFTALADRAFGKLKESVEHSGEIGVSVVNRLLNARKRLSDGNSNEEE